ncbi:MAG: DUF4085 family protein [Ruminococcaceae bacterium]|nr:DUF4085 family protein [Oscillospiraceae bacterium]
MRYYTKEWYALMQQLHRADGLTPIPDKAYSEAEIDAFFQADLQEETARDRSLHRGAGAFNPAETISCFTQCYRTMTRHVRDGYPVWLCRITDPRLLALGRIPESAYRRLLAEDHANKQAFAQIMADAHNALAAENIPARLRDGLQLHDARLLRFEQIGQDTELILRKDGGWDAPATPYIRILFRGVTQIDREKGFSIRPRQDTEGKYSSGCTYLYHELYREEEGYALHILLHTRRALRYLTVYCGDIVLEDNVEFPPVTTLSARLSALIGELEPAPACPTDSTPWESIYLDGIDTDFRQWRELIAAALRTAHTFAIHCWLEETEAIALALQHGTVQEHNWRHGTVIGGEVTPAFTDLILQLPRPAPSGSGSQFTPFFNIFLDDCFQSCHWGTEIHIRIPSNKNGGDTQKGIRP